MNLKIISSYNSQRIKVQWKVDNLNNKTKVRLNQRNNNKNINTIDIYNNWNLKKDHVNALSRKLFQCWPSMRECKTEWVKLSTVGSC